MDRPIFPMMRRSRFGVPLRALDPATGKLKWEWKHASPTWAGVLSTAGGLVFTGDAEGNFIALEAAFRESAVALSVRRVGIFFADVICD